MKKLLVLDIGGTSIKCGIWKNGSLLDTDSINTPNSWHEMKQIIYTLAKEENKGIEGVAISTPGAVDVENGIINGVSAIKYIHRFPIRKELENHLQLPVSIQNDANCAALAEVWKGNASTAKSSIYLIIGSGIGGAIVVDGKLITGSHLFGGEFGLMIIDSRSNKTLSESGSPVTMSKQFTQEKNDGHLYSGKEIFSLAEKGDLLAIKYTNQMLQAIAVGAFNLAVTIDPEMILIGGAISRNGRVIEEIEKRLKELITKKEAYGLAPIVKPCFFLDKANMLGAVRQFFFENTE